MYFTLLDLFFIVFTFNLFVCFCFLYNLFQIIFFHSIQGSKLKIKMRKEVN